MLDLGVFKNESTPDSFAAEPIICIICVSCTYRFVLKNAATHMVFFTQKLAPKIVVHG